MGGEFVSHVVNASLFSDEALTAALDSIQDGFNEAEENSEAMANLREAGHVLAAIAFDRGLIGEWLWKLSKEGGE
jgi:hypothetical protein